VTLVELLVCALLSTIAVALIADALLGLMGRSGVRMVRTGQVAQGLRDMAQVDHDLERSVLTDSIQTRIILDNAGLVTSILRPDGKGAAMVPLWYRFDRTSGVLERSENLGLYQPVGRSRLQRVRFSCQRAPAGLGAGFVVLSCELEPLRLEAQPGQAGPGPTRSVLLWTARVISTALAGSVPPGWVEPE
jgi:hypothetical protein